MKPTSCECFISQITSINVRLEIARAAKHKHPSDCHALVLEGKLVDEKVGEIKKGMYCFFPANVEHGPEELEAGTVLFLYANGPLQ